jgi:alpha-1,6-mannosyltransferase
VSGPELRVVLTGSILVASTTCLAVTQARLGSTLFFVLSAAVGFCYLAQLALVWRAPANRRVLLIALAFAAACRVPVTLGPVNYDSDMIRYIWDGRVQRFGYSPYSVIPADPALAHTHTADTARMPSRNVGTPYLPAAQLFFRAMVTLWESPLTMKLALLALDLLTILVLLRWLRITGRSEWLVLAYAWNPLVILESAHSSHIDVLGTFWITASAYWLAGRRTALASCAFTLAVATKLLPIVLAPLFIGRIRHRDIALGIGLLVALYLPFMSGAALPVGAVPSVVEHIRFNSPIFRPLAWVITPNGAAVFALLVGFGAAVWARVKLDANNPAAWAWPMALALLCAPVIYPWYLLYFTPFLFTGATLPLTVWTFTAIPVYIVWERARSGARWRVPTELMVLEFGLVVLAVVIVSVAARSAFVRGTQTQVAKLQT